MNSSSTSPRIHLKTSKSAYTASESNNNTTIPSTISASVSLSPKRTASENPKNTLIDDSNASLRHRVMRNSLKHSPLQKSEPKSDFNSDFETNSNLLTLLSEMEQSLPMFKAKWRVIDLFGGLQIYKQSVRYL